VAGQGWLAWKALLAAGLHVILPFPVRVQVLHFFADVLGRASADRAVVQPADRDAFRVVERELLRLAEAQDGTAAARRQIARTRLRIIPYHPIGGFCLGQ